MHQSIVLLGYMGSGKSVVGKLLSERLDIPFVDLDVYIEHNERKTIAAIFQQYGELHFRTLERQYLDKLFQKNEITVIALGGGTPCYFDTMAILQKMHRYRTVYLKTSISELAQRLFDQRLQRPIIAHIETMPLLQEFIGKHLFERDSFYRMSEISIASDQKEITDIVDEIVTNLS